eukprot:CAMPEP_0181309254 /NCGR_PEP_ID=MMETSP1101-20121128/11916_1 /TAXON_ID=46948 /ORGANISM="Rhodomonas abbreviata, Strain Caron Lab Isolate" /LENGTH=131 /DNA_ID=CAMNT_0023415727 /DNA_START=470 /DNA_END=861 /DNA_ORIENTATION=-
MAFFEGGSGGGVGQMDKLQLLPRGLLGWVWPADRVVMGLRVCQWMHKELVCQVENVLLVGVDTAVGACAVRQSFNLFQQSNVLVHWRGIGLGSLASLSSGIGAVLDGGVRGWLVELDLSNGSIGAEGAGVL